MTKTNENVMIHFSQRAKHWKDFGCGQFYKDTFLKLYYITTAVD